MPLTAKALFLGFALLGTACTRASTARDEFVTKAQPNDSIIRAALEAQLFGFGGCSRVEDVDTLGSSWFPELRLVSGRCEAEHGGTLAAIVGVNRQGVLFHLGDPLGFAFLLRLHTPAKSPLGDALGYAELALRFTGELRAGEQVVISRNAVDREVAAALDSARVTRLTRALNSRERISVIEVISATATRVREHQVAVRHNGEARVSTKVLWERKNIH